MKGKPIIILAGPTASGKTQLALDIATDFPAVIINADSKQVYRQIPVLTAQPSSKQQDRIPHALYGMICVTEHYTVFSWLKQALTAIQTAHQQGRIPLLVGGTGLYIKSLLEGISPIPDIPLSVTEHVQSLYQTLGKEGLYNTLQNLDPLAAATLHAGDSQRVMRACAVMMHTGTSIRVWQKMPRKPFYPRECFLTCFLAPDRHDIYHACNNRFLIMVREGALEEARHIASLSLPSHLPAYKAHGLPELLDYLEVGFLWKPPLLLPKKIRAITSNVSLPGLTTNYLARFGLITTTPALPCANFALTILMATKYPQYRIIWETISKPSGFLSAQRITFPSGISCSNKHALIINQNRM